MKNQKKNMMNQENKENKKKQPSHIVEGIASATIAYSTSATTNGYNKECNDVRQKLNWERQKNQESLNSKLSKDPSYTGDRSKGVDLAWKYEKAEIQMGGKGTGNWNSAQRTECLRTGKVRGAEGHHNNSVAENPAMQVNPDNIVFCSDRKEHLRRHNGNFQNPSSGSLIDRDKRLVDTNRKRTAENEVTGVLFSIGVAAGCGVGRSVWRTCKEDGWKWKSVKKGVKQSGKPVLESCCRALVFYSVMRGFTCLTEKIAR